MRSPSSTGASAIQGSADRRSIVSLAMAARAYDWQRPEISLGQELM